MMAMRARIVEFSYTRLCGENTMTDARGLAARLRNAAKEAQACAVLEEAATCQEVERLGFMTHDAKSMSRNASTLRDFSELALETSAALEAQAEEIAQLKPKLTARAKDMLHLRDVLTFVVDELDDEGDRVYFGSSNHAEQLREITESFDGWTWNDIIKDSKNTDYIGECASLHARIAVLEQAADELAVEMGIPGASQVDVMREALRRTRETPDNARPLQEKHVSVGSIGDSAPGLMRAADIIANRLDAIGASEETLAWLRQLASDFRAEAREENYPTLLACWRSGQMSHAQFEAHQKDDPGFAAYVREIGAKPNSK